MERIGIKESFGEVGSQDYLMDRFGLRAENIVQAAMRVIERKKNSNETQRRKRRTEVKSI
jgi:transketolase